MLVYTTVINLGGALSSLGILGSNGNYGGLDVVWMAFRDLANILIIGIFVFIAISIILGLEQFGQKKLIARVLIIAILINFSLLFSKIIVDVSNLVAFQFYKGMVGVDENGNIPQTSLNPTATQVGIAGAFMGKLGIQTALDGGKIFEFKDTEAKHALIPLVRVEAIEERARIQEALERFQKHRHSRMPVYSGRIDNIVGTLEVADLFGVKNLGEAIQDWVKPAHYVPETQSLEDLQKILGRPIEVSNLQTLSPQDQETAKAAVFAC
jgi:CBS domain containing-hemolysin-like protein